MVSTPKEGGLKETRDEDNNIIIIDSTLLSMIPHQLKEMSKPYKLIFGYDCCIYSKIIHSYLLSWRDWYLKNIKDLSQKI